MSTDTVPGPTNGGQVVMVSPDLAAKWLALNNQNRNLRERVARAYASDMTNGDWRWTGETIKFATDGTLLDGQHRLRGVVIADVTVPFLVVQGIASEAQQDVDRGVPRKFADVLALRGEINASNLAALVRRAHGWESGRRRSMDGGQNPSTVAQLLRTLDKHPELREIVPVANRIGSNSELPASVAGLCFWIFSGIDEEDARFFFDRLVDGTDMGKGNPIYELRRTLHASKDVRGERSQTYLLAITIKAWNAFRAGDTVGLYRWKPGGAKPETFPEPE